ncbi:transmembrane protease serine 2-like [Engraulis encrasicolus]|uniref:transmembrane protease serine 2-like n=1 Tax=Engraulis encrasicolus TaxID=184585 RepID=UPI002FD2E03E
MATNTVDAESRYVNMGFEMEQRPPPFNPGAVRGLPLPGFSPEVKGEKATSNPSEVVGETPEYVMETVPTPPPKPKSLKKKCKNYTVTAVMILLVLGLCTGILLAYYFLSPCGGGDVMWCGDGLCVKKEQWCDGTPDCTNGDDETNCVRLSGTGFHLQAYSRSRLSWGGVCADGWTDEFGRQACERIGFSSGSYVSSGQAPVGSSGAGGFMLLPDDVKPTANILTNFQDSDTCPSGKIVTLRCIACGIKNSSRSERIVGGHEAAYGTWPWQVFLRDSMQQVICGGALIAPSWILTAAQCVQSVPEPSEWDVYVDFYNDVKTLFSNAKEVAQLIPYPQYNNKTQDNDIALMKLKQPLQMSDSLKPICLPNVNMNVTAPQPCWIVGFGRTSEGGATSSSLMEAEVPLIDPEQCNSKEVYNGKVTSSMICAGKLAGGVDRCEGDTGGPLMVEEDALWWLIGDISWGRGCGRVNKPGVYGNVTHFLPWIYAQMKLHNDA